MEVQVKQGDVFIKASGSNQKEVFAELAKNQEIFCNTNCGKCNGPAKFVVRHVEKGKKTYDYYEMHCLKCRARLSFGCSQDGESLFPKRKDENGNYAENNGWHVYKKEEDKTDE